MVWVFFLVGLGIGFYIGIFLFFVLSIMNETDTKPPVRKEWKEDDEIEDPADWWKNGSDPFHWENSDDD